MNNRFATALALALLPNVAVAQTVPIVNMHPEHESTSTAGVVQGFVPSVVILCPDATGGDVAQVCSSGSGSESVAPIPTSSASTGGNVATTTSAATVIPAVTRHRWSYQAQGGGYACASWVISAVTNTRSSTNVVTCGGAGAFALGNFSGVDFSPLAMETTALTIIGAAPSGGILALNISLEAQ